MASVRVKRGRSYSTLSTEQPTLRRQPLSGLFSTPNPNTPAPPSTRTPALDDTLPRRPRARSRVAESLLLNPARLAGQPGDSPSNSNAGTPALSPPTHAHLPAFLRSQQSRVTLHGGAVDVAIPGHVHSDRPPSRVGSAADQASMQFSDVEDPFTDSHHEENVVEMLDAIDPQVYTVSNLANFANSVLIPPLGFSRKPTVTLVSRARDPETTSNYEDELDQHVDDLLSKRNKMRRVFQGLWAFVKTPLGFFTAIYGFCVVFWGAAIVFFLAKIINLHNDYTQGFWVEVSSQVVNGLFTVTGVGLIPYRAFDTYRIIRIWHYKLLTRRLRKKAGLPPLIDEDDLPDPMYDPNYVHVLTEKQQKQLHRQQRKFHYSQSWYRPHGTATHRAFPIRFAIIICLLNDLNSVFQIILCATMWSLNRFQRPAWSTGILIPLGFISGISAAIVIWKGGQKTRRTKEVEDMLRNALQIEAVEKSMPELPPSLSSTRRKDTAQEGGTTRPSIHIEPPIPERGDSSVFVEEEMTVPSKEQIH